MATRPRPARQKCRRSLHSYIYGDGHKFRPLPIKPWKWEPGQNNRGVRVSRGTLCHFRIRRTAFSSSSVVSLLSFVFLRLLCPAERPWPAASPRCLFYDPPAVFPLSCIALFFLRLYRRCRRSVGRLEKLKGRGPYCQCERKIRNLAAACY